MAANRGVSVHLIRQFSQSGISWGKAIVLKIGIWGDVRNRWRERTFSVPPPFCTAAILKGPCPLWVIHDRTEPVAGRARSAIPRKRPTTLSRPHVAMAISRHSTSQFRSIQAPPTSKSADKMYRSVPDGRCFTPSHEPSTRPTPLTDTYYLRSSTSTASIVGK